MGSDRVTSKFNINYVADKEGKSLIQHLRNIQNSTYIKGFDSLRRQQQPQTNKLLSATKLNTH